MFEFTVQQVKQSDFQQSWTKLYRDDIVLFHIEHEFASNANWKIANDFQVYCQQLNWWLTYCNADRVHRNHFINIDMPMVVKMCMYTLEENCHAFIEVMPADCGYDDDTAHTHSHATVNDKN